jgi:oxalate decarboxylase/phosphoglucose isomerase-like protein (cupin superfamily)
MERIIRQGVGRARVELQWSLAGDDLLILISGGERAHIGAVALSYPCQGTRGQTVTTSLLTAPGHKEGELAYQCAERLCRALGHTIQVTCGIHIDDAAQEEIGIICENVQALQDRLMQILQKRS